MNPNAGSALDFPPVTKCGKVQSERQSDHPVWPSGEDDCPPLRPSALSSESSIAEENLGNLMVPSDKNQVIRRSTTKRKLKHNRIENGGEFLAKSLNHWCSHVTIQKWLHSFPDYGTYVQRPLPLLTKVQKAKQAAFARRFLNKWELPPQQKVLLINFDEKWFWGLVARMNAKTSVLMGVEKQFQHVFHKGHINKVMVVAFTGYAFNGDYEDGGHGLKLGLFRCAAARVAKKHV